MVEKPNNALVLVVDDHFPAADMMKRLFTVHDYRVVCSYSGEDALVQAQRLQPDLILLDVMMPGMNGFEVLKVLREQDATVHIPTILVTAKDTPSDIEYGLNLGADDYLTKPVEPRELLARVRSKIESRRLREALQRRTTDLEALLRVAEELNNTLRVEELEQLVLYLMLDLLPCSVAVMVRLNDMSEVVSQPASQRDDAMPLQQFDVSTLLAAINEAPLQQWSQETSILTGNYPYGMAVALEHNVAIRGTLVVFGMAPYDDHHLRLFLAIARHAALALRNAELYEMQVRNAETLEVMVAERTEQLRSAQQLLIRSEKLASVGRLAAGIAHEINNPLLPIIINLELLTEDLQENKPIAHEPVEEALNSARRISRTIERLLQFTRKRENAPDMEVLHVATVLDSVIALSRRFLQQDGINITTHIDPQVSIYGNKDQLEQVFLNIMLNAKAAMERGGLLDIRTRVTAKHITLAFKDSGTGIAPDILEKIFEPFFTTKDNGSGLGLFISHEIVQNHNGTIDVSSQMGMGTTVTLTFPIVENIES